MHRVLSPLLAILATGLPAQAPQIHTSRTAGKELLRLPKTDEAFGFVVFGDRTGGPPDGIKVLAQAVADTNLLDPDLVFTVGDLVNGYNTTPQWLLQAAEYKGAMQKLRMPWYPVAGNHDIYWRGAGKPPGEHEGDYEQHFGPLWYAIEHKQCWFIALYSDEGDPATGEKDFSKPAAQKMSEAQFSWLAETLQQAKGARHVFLFLHHPRWVQSRGYGDDWQRVHELLAKAGNVTAVFGGHIHRMRFDGVRDGIQYYTVASVGAYLEMEAPRAGYLHEFHVVTVRPQGITVAALPVGTVLDPQQITGELSEDVEHVHERLRPTYVAIPDVDAHGGIDGLLEMTFTNPGERPIELTIVPLNEAPMVFAPDHAHLTLAPGASAPATLHVHREGDHGHPFAGFELPRFELRCDYLAEGVRIGLPKKEYEVMLAPPAKPHIAGQGPGALQLDGKKGCLELASQRLALPDGPFTVQARIRARDYQGRRGLASKMQSSEFGLMVSDGKVEFLVHLDGKYATAETTAPVLQVDTWHHVAGVFDGAELRAYVDGRLVARKAGKGVRTRNELPLILGGDPDGAGKRVSFVDGLIDEVMISIGALWTGDTFEVPAVLPPADATTVLRLPFDRESGTALPWCLDSSANGAHPRRHPGATVTATNSAR
ncbi:MAG: metallophosphoesterase [Planctomycetes bacterium]|nr:metallophosphoesterase [Planctomycetota bacterium]